MLHHVRARRWTPTADARSVSVAVLIGPDAPEDRPVLQQIPDSAKLFAVGTLLVGLAAAVRKAG